MKAFSNINVSSIDEAVSAAAQARSNGQSVAFSGGGTDLLQQLKDGTDKSDVIINLRNVDGAKEISSANGTTRIGGLITLEELSNSDCQLCVGAGGCQRWDTTDSQRRNSVRQCHSAPMVLVLPQWF